MAQRAVGHTDAEALALGRLGRAARAAPALRLRDAPARACACLRRRADRPASHDDLFHSVLGLLEIHTAVYDRNHDVFSGCDA